MKRRGRPPHPDILTPREWEVLELLRLGLTNDQIADRLGVTIHAARYHVSEILSKLQVSTREEAARWQPQPERAASRWSLSRFGFAGLGIGIVSAAAVGITVLAVGSLNASSGDETDPTPRPSPNADAPVPDASGRLVTVANPEGIDRLYIFDVNDPRNRDVNISNEFVLTPITPGPPKSDIDLSTPRWSPDGSTIAYLAHRTVSEEYTLRLVSPDGEDFRILATLNWDDSAPECGGGEQLVWSPNGDRIAVYSRADGLLVIDVESGDATEIEGAAGPGIGWSPDSDKLVYVTHEEPSAEEVDPFDVASGCRITIANSNGKGDHEAIAHGQGPAWSPDGSLIAFGRDGELYVIDADGDAEHKLTQWANGTLLDDSMRRPFTPRWSPDSTRIMADSKTTLDMVTVGSDLDAPPDCGVGELLLDSSGNPVLGEEGIIFVTPEPLPEGHYPSCGGNSGTTGANPQWSPDSNWFAFLNDRPNSDNRIFIISWNIKGVFRLAAIGNEFDWGP